LLALLLAGGNAHAAKVVVIGDSLSAEYDGIPAVPGTEDPTAYAAITVPGWESMTGRNWPLRRSSPIRTGP